MRSCLHAHLLSCLDAQPLSPREWGAGGMGRSPSDIPGRTRPSAYITEEGAKVSPYFSVRSEYPTFWYESIQGITKNRPGPLAPPGRSRPNLETKINEDKKQNGAGNTLMYEFTDTKIVPYY